MANAVHSFNPIQSSQPPAERFGIFKKILDCIKRVWEAVKSIFCCCQRTSAPNTDVLSTFMEKEKTVYGPALTDLQNAVKQYTLGRPLQERELTDLTQRKEAAEGLFEQESQEYANVQRISQTWPRSTHGMQYRMSGMSEQISRLLSGQSL